MGSVLSPEYIKLINIFFQVFFVYAKQSKGLNIIPVYNEADLFLQFKFA